MLASCLYQGQVMHHRLAPVGHRFRYPVVSLLLDLGELKDLRLRLFSYNRHNLFCIHDRDFGEGYEDPRAWVDGILDRHGLSIPGGSVRVHLFPRVLGFGFTPLTTWFCHDADGDLKAILYQVHNTFGERHAYLVPITGSSGGIFRHGADKCFHVSPFIQLATHYAFTTRTPAAHFALTIRETDRESGAPILVASHVARRVPLTDAALARAALAYPLLPLKIIGGIHWEALLIWLKGGIFHRKPQPPATFVTLADADSIHDQ